jgi:hypothetical protein
MDHDLARSLYIYAKGSEERISRIEAMQEDALSAVVSGKGQQLISTSGNGVSVAFSSKSMTNEEFFSTLTLALGFLSNGGPKTKTNGLLR